MGQQDLYRDMMATGPEELLKKAGGLIELLAR